MSAKLSKSKRLKSAKSSRPRVEEVDDKSSGSNGEGGNDSGGDDDDDDEQESPYRDPPVGFVRLRPSQFKHIPPTVFIEYPPELEMKRVDISKLEELGNRKLCYTSYWERICIKNAFLRAGFTKSAEGSAYWTAMWSKHQNESQLKSLNCLQKVNHFPESWCIGRKDRLSRTLNTMKRLHGPEHWSFHPDSYILPQERDAFQRLVKNELASVQSRGGKEPLWILKPVASSCGRGIRVLNSQQALQVPLKKKALLQRYLMKPYLIDGNKFDLRIYVLVSGVDPLRIYIHEEGLTRISTSKYSLSNISNRFAHLTNYSVNKKASVFKAATLGSPKPGDGAGSERLMTEAAAEEAEVDPETEGFKWSLTAFRRWLTKQTSKAVMEETFARIHDLCVKTIIAAEGDITPNLYTNANYRTNCYELFGMDVILDSNLQPSLLEVNVSPSLMGSSPLDKRIKGTVIADLLHIVGIYPHDSKILKKWDSDEPVSGTANRGIARGDEAYNNAYSNTNTGNPFAFTSLTKMMNSQDNYRKNPCPATIDIAKLNDNDDSSWLLLLMIEDEFSRARSSRFALVHPLPASCTHYTSLYRNGRFSDHLLAKWTLSGGSRGSCKQYIPDRYLFDAPTKRQPQAVPLSRQPQRTIALSLQRPVSAARRPSSASGLPRPNTTTSATTATSSRINVTYTSNPKKRPEDLSSTSGEQSPNPSGGREGIATAAVSEDDGGDIAVDVGSDLEGEEDVPRLRKITSHLSDTTEESQRARSPVKGYLNSTLPEDKKEDHVAFMVDRQRRAEAIAEQAATNRRVRQLELLGDMGGGGPPPPAPRASSAGVRRSAGNAVAHNPLLGGAGQLPQRSDLGHGSVLQEFDRMIEAASTAGLASSKGDRVLFARRPSAAGFVDSTTEEVIGSVLGLSAVGVGGGGGGSAVSSLGQSRNEGADLQRRIADMSLAINKAIDRATLKPTASMEAAWNQRRAQSQSPKASSGQPAFDPLQSPQKARQLLEAHKSATAQRQYKLLHETDNHYTVSDMRAIGLTNEDLYKLKAHSGVMESFHHRTNPQLMGKVQAHRDRMGGSFSAVNRQGSSALPASGSLSARRNETGDGGSLSSFGGSAAARPNTSGAGGKSVGGGSRSQKVPPTHSPVVGSGGFLGRRESTSEKLPRI